MRLDDEATFGIGNISGQQLCLSKLFSRQPLPRSRGKQTWSQVAGQTMETATEITWRGIWPGCSCVLFLFK